MSAVMPYEYVVLRCVPRADREEFVNVAVVLHCRDADFLAVRAQVPEQRILALAPQLDLAQLHRALDHAAGTCTGDADRAGDGALEPLSRRFGFLKAPRSTVLQPGPVHGGVTPDPATALEQLAVRMLG